MAGVSMGDIAKSLDLSLVTVSMVMNGKSEKWRISEATKERVLRKAQEMGYRRNANARAMITGKTKLIGYVEMDLSGEPSSRTLQGLAEAADAAGYSVKVFVYKSPEGFEPALHRIMEHRPAALMYRMRSHEDLALFRKECLGFNVPLLVHGSAYPMDWGLRVNTDDVAGERLAVEHLLSLGHRDIWHVGSPGEGIEFADSRFKGFVEALANAGVESPERLLLRVREGGELDVPLERLLRGGCRPTALCCMSDYLAMRAIRVARRRGLSIPGDLAVVGYAGLEMSEYADPPLTTVAEPFEEVGRAAFRLMRSEIENPDKPSFKQELCEQLPVRLLVRESTTGGKFNVAS